MKGNNTYLDFLVLRSLFLAFLCLATSMISSKLHKISETEWFIRLIPHADHKFRNSSIIISAKLGTRISLINHFVSLILWSYEDMIEVSKQRKATKSQRRTRKARYVQFPFINMICLIFFPKLRLKLIIKLW